MYYKQILELSIDIFHTVEWFRIFVRKPIPPHFNCAMVYFCIICNYLDAHTYSPLNECKQLSTSKSS